MFKTKRFLEEQFKTPHGLRRFLSAYGVNAPSSTVVQKWFTREAVPAPWLGVLLGYLELENGRPVSLVEYVARV